MRAFIAGIALLLLTTASGCKHEVETYTSETLADYLPLTEGKYIIYQLDSTIFIGFTLSADVHHYQEKQLVGAPIADNNGRQTFPVYRYLRDSAGSLPWAVAGTYYITPTGKTMEVVENNLRTVRLTLPVKPGFSWKGNGYLPDDAYAPAYDFSNDNSLNVWEYTYGTPGTETMGNTTLKDVVPVLHISDTLNVKSDFKAAVDTLPAYRDFSVDKYAKGIGLVYQELVLWELEPNSSIDNSTRPPSRTFSPFYKGFGVKRTLLEHN